MEGFSLKKWIEEYRSKYWKGHDDPYNKMAYKYDDLSLITQAQSDDLQREFIKIESEVVKDFDFNSKDPIETIDMPCCLTAAKRLLDVITDESFVYLEYEDDFVREYEDLMNRFRLQEAFDRFKPLASIAKEGCDLTPLYLELVDQIKSGQLKRYPLTNIRNFGHVLDYVSVSMKFSPYNLVMDFLEQYGLAQSMKKVLERNDNSNGLVNYVNKNMVDELIHESRDFWDLDSKKITKIGFLDKVSADNLSYIEDYIKQLDLDMVEGFFKNRQKFKQSELDLEIFKLKTNTMSDSRFNKKELENLLRKQQVMVEGQNISMQHLESIMGAQKNMEHKVKRQ